MSDQIDSETAAQLINAVFPDEPVNVRKVHTSIGRDEKGELVITIQLFLNNPSWGVDSRDYPLAKGNGFHLADHENGADFLSWRNNLEDGRVELVAVAVGEEGDKD